MLLLRATMADRRWPHEQVRGIMETDADIALLVHRIVENAPDSSAWVLGTMLLEAIGHLPVAAQSDAAAVGQEMLTFVDEATPLEPVVIMSSSIEVGAPCGVCAGSMERDAAHDHSCSVFDVGDDGECRVRGGTEWMLRCDGECGTYAFAGGTATALRGGTTTLQAGVLSRAWLRLSKATFISTPLVRRWWGLQLRGHMSFDAIAQAFNDSAFRANGGNETTAVVGQSTRGRSSTARILDPKIVRDAIALFLALDLNDRVSSAATEVDATEQPPLFDTAPLYNKDGLDRMLLRGTPALLRAIQMSGRNHLRDGCPHREHPYFCVTADGGVKCHS